MRCYTGKNRLQGNLSYGFFYYLLKRSREYEATVFLKDELVFSAFTKMHFRFFETDVDLFKFSFSVFCVHHCKGYSAVGPLKDNEKLKKLLRWQVMQEEKEIIINVLNDHILTVVTFSATVT